MPTLPPPRRIIVQPHRLDLESPGRRDYWVALEHDSIWGDHLMPLTVFVGPKARAGEGLVAFGANHGNEYEGPIAIKHLLREIDIGSVEGRLILIPVLNPPAFLAGTRESTLDDGVNLNRAFVEGAGVTPALAGITLTPSPNPDPGLVRESSCPDWGWKGFSDEEATQCRADRGLASAG